MIHNFIQSISDKITGAVGKSVKEELLYTVCLSNFMTEIKSGLPAVFPCKEYLSWRSKPFDDNGRLTSRYKYDPSQNTNNVVKFYKGIPVIFNSRYEKSTNGPDYTVTVSTIRTKKNIEIFHEFIEKLIYKGAELTTEWSETLVSLSDGKGWNETVGFQFRTFDDVFIDDEDEKLIKESLDAFINNRKWYAEHSIPYHFGILLYGDPGVGKSSLALAINKYINGKMYTINGDHILSLPEKFGSYIPTWTPKPDMYRTLLVEDIDCGFASGDLKALLRSCGMEYDKGEKNGDKKSSNARKIGMAGLLNALDGATAPSNTVYIFTTNHIDKLDPALIRPGRCDLKIELKFTRNAFDKFCVKHYGMKSEEEFNLKEGLTFADLQVHVMKGMSFEELIKYVKEE